MAELKNYQFEVGNDQAFSKFHFFVTAATPAEAVEGANKVIAEPDESQLLVLADPIRQAFLDINTNFRVDESMIVSVTPAKRAIPIETYNYLIGEGYQYSGGTSEFLWFDDEPNFVKPIYTEDGQGIYGMFIVETRNNNYLDGCSFGIRAVIYPIAGARVMDGRGGAQYMVDFQDKQDYIYHDELPKLLPLYERKFTNLIYALREADPEDGLPFQ